VLIDLHGDENDTRQMNEAEGRLEELARALLVLCHHTSKAGEQGDGSAAAGAPGDAVPEARGTS
jgi:hypothetical protein